MNTRNPDFITVDLRGLKAALVSCAQARRESVSVLVRRAVARELGQSESVPQMVVETECLDASPVPQVKLSIRLTTPEARRLAVGAHIAQMSREALLAGLITGVPALITGATRTAEIVELIKSNSKLSSLNRTIHTLSRLLARSNMRKAVTFRDMLDMLDALDGDVQRHLAQAAALMASLRPRGSSTESTHRPTGDFKENTMSRTSTGYSSSGVIACSTRATGWSRSGRNPSRDQTDPKKPSGLCMHQLLRKLLSAEVGRGLRRAALYPHGSGAGLALTTLGGHAHVDLDVVKAGAAARRLGDGFVVHSAADTDDHGGREQ